MKINLGCGRSPLPGWVNIDCSDLPEVDLVINLDQPHLRIPLLDDSADEIFCSHTFEHIINILPLMQELHRVAKVGAKATFRVPYGSSDDADEDPTHVRRCFLYTFGYFSQPFYWRADYGYRGDWHVERITLITWRGTHTPYCLEEIMKYRNTVREMVVELVAVKPIREPKRELQVPPQIIIQEEQ